MSFAFTSHTVACSITSISCAFPFYPLTLLSFSISHQKLCCAFSNFPFSFLFFFSSPTPCSFYMYTRCIYGQGVCFSSCIRVILQEQTQSMQVLWHVQRVNKRLAEQCSSHNHNLLSHVTSQCCLWSQRSRPSLKVTFRIRNLNIVDQWLLGRFKVISTHCYVVVFFWKKKVM